jgi:oligoribonuclease NrnB/cAMP/cGMP phosphodiesterase (DHH superfamily)
MKKFDRTSRVLSISHGDFDGISCQIIIGNVFENVEYTNAEFYTIDKKLMAVDYSKYDIVFLTDIHPEREESFVSDKIVMIDHHPSEFDNPAKNRFVVSNKKKCAAFLVKFFFEKLYGDEINISHLDDLIRLTNDYDIWIHNDPKSKLINELHKNLYETDEFRDRFFDGDVELTEAENKYIVDRAQKFTDTYNNLEIFELDNVESLHPFGCVIFATDFINDLADKMLKETGYRYIIVRNQPKGRTSIRHNIAGVHIGEILTALEYGGGHEFAGAFFERDNDMFYKKVLAVEEAIGLKVTSKDLSIV